MGGRDIKKNIISNLFWKLMEKSGTQGIQFIVQILLARLLLPEDYGILAIITIFINFSNTIIQNGFNMALIQKKKVDDLDFSSVFYMGLILSGLLYVSIYFSAPIIANFYKNAQLISLLRVSSITLFLGAFNSIQIAIVSRQMLFKKLFFSSLVGMIVSGFVGILLAYMGFGVWSLVFQQIINQFLISIILWFTVKWRPILKFSYNRIRILFSFGSKILISSLIYNLYNDLRLLVIGKVFSPQVLGFYNRGSQFPDLIVNNIDGSIQSVMLTVFSSQQDDKTRLKTMVRRSITTSSFIIFPLMIGLAVVAEPLVLILLTDKWLPSVPFIRIFCIGSALRPIHTANQQAVNAIGRSDISLRLNIIKRLVDFVILGITIFFGVYAIALGGILSGLIGSVINAYPNKKILNYSYQEQLRDILPHFSLSLVMGILVYCIQFINISLPIRLMLQIFTGVFVYYGMSRIFKIESYHYIVITIKDFFNK